MTAGNPHRPDSRYAWWRLAASLAISTLGGVGLWSAVVVLPTIETEFGVSRGGASLPFTVTMLGFAVGGIGMGRLADRFGINIRKKNTHLPDGMAKNVRSFCAEYESRIEACGGIDVQVLGIGSDGHIGFNEPGSSLASRTRIKTLTEQTINDNSRFFVKKADVPIYAITMGIGTVLDAARIVLVANGKNKAATVAAAFEGPVSCMCTATALQLHSDSIIFIDEAAASGLKMRDYYDWVQSNKAKAPT